MNYLKSKSSLGNIFLTNENEFVEVFSIGEGRLSCTPKEDFYLINFWIRAEYEVEIEKEQFVLVWGPTLEILSKSYVHLREAKIIKIEMEYKEDTETIWSEYEEAHFYYQIHQSLENSKLKITRENENFYSIEFSGIPFEDRQNYVVKGNCKLELTSELKKYW